ncbi:MAG: GtrA family protein [Bacteroidales bacterium]|nr:GtrA family protein [Bacteroidales bacterium]
MKTLQHFIIILLDALHKPFAKIIPQQTFRYAACGGGNSALDILLYFIAFHFVLHESIVELGFVAISGHIAAFLLVFPITFSTGFLLGKYITFTQSELRGRIQLLRYGITVGGSILLNYLFLKLFVEYVHLFPTVSKILTTFFVVAYSYVVQKYYTFKVVATKG